MSFTQTLLPKSLLKKLHIRQINLKMITAIKYGGFLFEDDAAINLTH